MRDVLEAYRSIGQALLLVGIGSGLLMANYALSLLAGFSLPLIWAAAPVIVFGAARAIDRRPVICASREGFSYTPWGGRFTPWAEIEALGTFRVRDRMFISLQPAWPEQFRTSMPWMSRVNSAVNERLGRPAFYITPTGLDVSPEMVFKQMLACAAPAT